MGDAKSHVLSCLVFCSSKLFVGLRGFGLAACLARPPAAAATFWVKERGCEDDVILKSLFYCWVCWVVCSGYMYVDLDCFFEVLGAWMKNVRHI